MMMMIIRMLYLSIVGITTADAFHVAVGVTPVEMLGCVLPESIVESLTDETPVADAKAWLAGNVRAGPASGTVSDLQRGASTRRAGVGKGTRGPRAADLFGLIRVAIRAGDCSHAQAYRRSTQRGEAETFGTRF